MEITIRHLLLDDYICFTNLISTNITLEEYNNFCNNILSNKHIIIVALVNNIIVGTGTLLIEPKLTYNLTYMGHIENLYVSEHYRINGIGKKIINHLISYAKNFGCYRIDLICKNDLCEFYNNIGFTLEQVGMTMIVKDNFKLTNA